jgi:hypothetical protein
MPIIANSYPSKLIIEGDSLEPDRKQVGLGGHKKLAFFGVLGWNFRDKQLINYVIK